MLLTGRENYPGNQAHLWNLYRKVGSNPTTGQQNPIPFTPIEEATTPGTGDIDKATNRFRTGTTYNEAGQVTQDDKFRSMGFSYDANGRVVKATRVATPDAHTVYDALGNRVATKVNDVWQYMVYDAFGRLVAEYGVAGEGMGGVKYVQMDHQGSVRTITNSNGFVVSRTDHQAFGETISSGVGLRNVNQGYGVDPSTRQSYGLTETDDASGQQHTWFRKLETQAGRWSSPDPYKGSMSLGDPQSFNRYAYVNNQPTNYVDPSGLAVPACELSGGEIRCSFSGNYSGADVGYSGGGILITTSVIQPHVEAKPEVVFRSYSFFSFFYGFGGSATAGVNDLPLPFNSCDEFVEWLVTFAENPPYGIRGDKDSRAKVTGLVLMDLAFNGYHRHINNGYAGFKDDLVQPGTGTAEGPQGAGVYGHVMGMAGAYLMGVMTGGRIVGWANSAIDHFQNSVSGKAQGPAEVAGNRAGTSAGKHIWNLIQGDGNGVNLRQSLTSDLCK